MWRKIQGIKLKAQLSSLSQQVVGVLGVEKIKIEDTYILAIYWRLIFPWGSHSSACLLCQTTFAWMFV